MISLSFSTSRYRLIPENELSNVVFARAVSKTVIPTLSFPHILPHPFFKDRGSVFSGIAGSMHFCTGSTTNTNNINQRISCCRSS